MYVRDFDFDLPEELIAQDPAQERGDDQAPFPPPHSTGPAVSR